MTAFADRTGAVVDGSVVAHYGDPMREQRALARGTAVSALGDRAVIEVAGPERLTWLDTITSQALARLAPGESTELLVLDPQGRVEHAAGVVDDGASTWLIVDAGDAEGLATWLSRMVFRAQVTVTLRPELTPVGAMAGGAAAESLVAVAIAPSGVAVVWNDPWPEVQPGGHQYSSVTDHPGADYHWRVGLVDDDGMARLDDIEAAGALAADALRIAAWRPRWAAEVDDRSLPHESDWLRSAVHLAKGCYRGQETVAKVHNLGHPPRRLAALHLDGSAETPPPAAMPSSTGNARSAGSPRPHVTTRTARSRWRSCRVARPRATSSYIPRTP